MQAAPEAAGADEQCFGSPCPSRRSVLGRRGFLSPDNGGAQGRGGAAQLGAAGRDAWRGVSLGGWLIMEPGPSWKLFRFAKEHQQKQAAARAVSCEEAAKKPEPLRCEWDLMRCLREMGPEGLAALKEHRETFITREDFARIRDAGLNAVRVPFGYWCVLGSTRPAAAAAGQAMRSKSGRTATGVTAGRARKAASSNGAASAARGQAGAARAPKATIEKQRKRLQLRKARPKDPYEGPALEYLDRAVAWAEEFGLQVLLDLHGAPGGESGEAPCGRRQRPGWDWRQWRFEESLRALRILVRRYRGSPAVTGIAVCNEPSPEVPTRVLCRFYDRAVKAIRRAGLRSSKATVVLPVFQRSLASFVSTWEEMSPNQASRENVCFEVHWYHCFENAWHGRSFAQHLRAVQEHAEALRHYPIVVGEWSLALGMGSLPTKISKEEMMRLFANAQLAAYREASHGWFFWSWSDHPGSAEWDWQQALGRNLVPEGSALRDDLPDLPKLPLLVPEDPAGPEFGSAASPMLSAAEVRTPNTPLPEMPGRKLIRRSSRGPARSPPRDSAAAAALALLNDPLEAAFDEPASDTRVLVGDTIYLRAFHGRYLDVEGSSVRARYGDRGKWQQFLLCPYLGPGGSADVATRSQQTTSRGSSAPIRDGDIVSLLAHTGKFLGVVGKHVRADWSQAGTPACAFVVRTAGISCEVRHRQAVFLQSLATSKVLAPNESDPADRESMLARWKSFGEWQQLLVEKPRCTAVHPHRPRRRSSMAQAVAAGSPAPAASAMMACSPRSTVRGSAKESAGLLGLPSPPASWTSSSQAPGTPSRKRRASIAGQADAADLEAVATPSRRPRRQSLSSHCATVSAVLEAVAASPALLDAATPRRRRASV
eukprot:TRINITY_DN26196_c0_g1_i2.p1 TRINITY_DN26196_c0_g1~~TRINITY_DN26196_c0_g1_i2.p1  ORF type:complete len:881 (-),score=142.97 TRINITY_DN26196_c0_g1_i2:47-2689(-)